MKVVSQVKGNRFQVRSRTEKYSFVRNFHHSYRSCVSMQRISLVIQTRCLSSHHYVSSDNQFSSKINLFLLCIFIILVHFSLITFVFKHASNTDIMKKILLLILWIMYFGKMIVFLRVAIYKHICCFIFLRYKKYN